jgi:hypothetical protein
MALLNEKFSVKGENGRCQFLKLLGSNTASKIWSATLSLFLSLLS